FYPRASRPGPYRHSFAAPSRLDRKVAKFWRAVLHRQYGLCVVQVDNWFERYARQHRCANIGQAKSGVVSHEMAAATRAELSVTHLRFIKMDDKSLSLRDRCVFCLPQDVGIHRTSGVGAA